MTQHAIDRRFSHTILSPLSITAALHEHATGFARRDARFDTLKRDVNALKASLDERLDAYRSGISASLTSGVATLRSDVGAILAAVQAFRE